MTFLSKSPTTIMELRQALTEFNRVAKLMNTFSFYREVDGLFSTHVIGLLKERGVLDEGSTTVGHNVPEEFIQCNSLKGESTLIIGFSRDAHVISSAVSGGVYSMPAVRADNRGAICRVAGTISAWLRHEI